MHDHNFIFILFVQVSVPGCILHCFDHVNMEDLSRPLAIVAKMVGYRPLASQLLREGLLNHSRVEKLLKGPIAKETLLDFLMIVSDLARMSKVCHLLAFVFGIFPRCPRNMLLNGNVESWL